MKKNFILICFCIFACLLMQGTTRNTVSAASKPDKVEIVDTVQDHLFDPEFFSEEDILAITSVWDTTKEIQVTYGNLCFHSFLSQDKEESWIFRVTQIKKQKLSKLVFPDTIQDAPVSKLGCTYNHSGSDFMANIWGTGVEPYHGCDGYDGMPAGITSVSIPATVTDIVFGSFCGFRDLTSIRIPDGVTDLGYATFYNCTALKKVTFPACLKTFKFDAFQKCKNLSTIMISKSSPNFLCKNGMMLSKDGKTLVWVQPKIRKLTIPNGVKTLGECATIYSYVTSVTIPKSVTYISDYSLNGNKITSIILARNNSCYGKTGDYIYSKRTHRLVAAICRNGTLTLPKQVYYLKNNVSIAGTYVHKLIIPRTFKGFQAKWYANSKYATGSIIFQSSTPPKAEKDSFSHSITYVVPKGSLDTYKQWYYDTEGIEEPDETELLDVEFQENH